LFAEATNQKVVSELCVELLQTFALTLQRLALTDDKPRSVVQLTTLLLNDSYSEHFLSLNVDNCTSLVLFRFFAFKAKAFSLVDCACKILFFIRAVFIHV